MNKKLAFYTTASALAISVASADSLESTKSSKIPKFDIAQKKAKKKRPPKKVIEEPALSIEKIDGPQHPAVSKGAPPKALHIAKNSHIGFVGGGLGSRMNLYSEFETEIQRRFPEHNLYIRNLCKEGDTPAFRPHPSRKSFYAFPGGKELVKEEYRVGSGTGHYPTPDEWLTLHSVDTVIGFFGYSESFDDTLKSKYTNNGAQLAIVGPAAFENLSAKRDLPDGSKENANIQAYSDAMKAICAEEGIIFVDAYSITDGIYSNTTEDSTTNGHNLTDATYKKLAPQLATAIFGEVNPVGDYEKTKTAVVEKNRLWIMDYKIPNGVHVHGRRYRPFGNDNYPDELKKIHQMTKARDQAIWAAAQGKSFDLAAADANTIKLKEIETNSDRPVKYLSGEEVVGKLKLPEGYKVQLFADEKQFPALANPSQMAFDNKGRLWVGCMGSYPHYKIGDPLPNDSILIFEDTDGDGKADKQTAFVDKIHIPMGFEITPEGGAIVSLGNDLVHFEDTDGDSKADKRTALLSGFDDHDTHHAISSFCADPSGAIYMGEGIFSHTNVETPYGPVRGTNGGFYRFNPKKGRLERTAQYSIPNPWGIAFNEWGQNFFLFTSNTNLSWMQQIAIKPKYNRNLKPKNLISSNSVRPTSGLEFISSRHFPEEVQGDVLLCNNIGFLGCKQHSVKIDPKTGFYSLKYKQDLFVSDKSYQYFRPVDLEFAPDGSLFFIDWSNVLIGHMQHSARDPKRDHVHGRIYRVTYPSRELVKPAKIDGAPIETLLENLKEPEYRTRYRTRRELRGRDADKVAAAVKTWVSSLDTSAEGYDHQLLEALWVTWGVNKIDVELTNKVLAAKDYRARAAAVRAVRYNAEHFDNVDEIMIKAAGDKMAIVRHEALVAATWLPNSVGRKTLAEFDKHPLDKTFSGDLHKYAKADIENTVPEPDPVVKVKIPAHLSGDKKAAALYQKGFEHYGHGESCGSCHLANGEGLAAANFPPLAKSEWVNGDKELLIKIALHGITGELEVKGKKFNGAMPGFAFRTPNKEIAEVLTYVRNSFGNKAPDGDFVITVEDVEKVLKDTKDQKGMYQAKDLKNELPKK